MEVFSTLKVLFSPAIRLGGWLLNRLNPVRQQAARILHALHAHGIERTQINRLLPSELQLKPICFSTADYLKVELTQAHVDWVAQFLALDKDWLDGTSACPHQLIFSYKQPSELHEWLVAYTPLEQQGFRFKVHLITSTDESITQQSHGDFVVVLEEHLDEVGEQSISRYYYLTEGSHLEHSPCILHLMEILALANHHGLIPQRWVMSEKCLRKLFSRRYLIPELLFKGQLHSLQPDHELWPHLSGNSPWLVQLRQETDASLERHGLGEVISSLNYDRLRFARPNTEPY